MEENLPNDRLEEFLKKAFEHFERQPSDGMWDKINQGLAAPETPVVPITSSSIPIRKWWLGVAAGLVFVLVAGQHFYFQQKLNALDKKWQQQINVHDHNNAVLPANNAENNENFIQHSEPTQQQVVENQSKINSNSVEIKLPNSTIQTGKNAAPNLLKASSGNVLVNNSVVKISENPEIFQHHEISNVDGDADVQDFRDDNLLMPSENIDINSLKISQLNSVKLLPKLDLQGLQQPCTASFFKEIPLVRPLKSSKWAVEAHAGVFSTSSSATFERSKFPRPNDKNLAFDGKLRGTTQMIGLGLEKKITQNWAFVSGVDFRESVMQHEIDVDFKFKDRKKLTGGPGGGNPPPPHRHDFNFNLNTGGGTAEVAFRVAEVDTSKPIDDDEKLNFQADNQQTLRWVSVPAVAKWNTDKGRWRIYLKGGLAANFLISNEFEFKNVKIDNPRFQIDLNRPSQKSVGPMQTITLDWLASAGMDFRLTKKWSVSVEPTLRGDLTDYLNLPFAQTNHLLVGLNFGVKYALN